MSYFLIISQIKNNHDLFLIFFSHVLWLVQSHRESFGPAQVTDKTSALVAQVSSDNFIFTFLMENVEIFIRELSFPVETTSFCLG